MSDDDVTVELSLDEEIAEAELIPAAADRLGPQSESNKAALVKVENLPARGALTAPIASVEEVRKAFDQYQELYRAIVTANDRMAIGQKSFVMKSGWRKLAVVMGVSCEERSRTYERDEQRRIFEAEVVVRAIAPNGRYQDGLGLCDYRERCCPRAYAEDAVCRNGSRSHTHCTTDCDGFNHFSKPQHDIPATAFTRAQNRACSDLFGNGEVSAEEITDRDEPLDEAECAKYAAAMNAVADERQRANVKGAFVRMFGMPNELKKGQVGAVERFLKAQNVDFSGAPAAGGAPATAVAPEAPDADAGGAYTPAESGEQREGSAPAGGDPGTLSDAREGDARPQGSPPKPSIPDGAKPSTAQQRRSIGMGWNQLVEAGIATAEEKAEVVALITGERASSTVDTTFDEAVKINAAVAHLKSGALALYDDEATPGRRTLGAPAGSQVGERFIAGLAS